MLTYITVPLEASSPWKPSAAAGSGLLRRSCVSCRETAFRESQEKEQGRSDDLHAGGKSWRLKMFPSPFCPCLLSDLYHPSLSGFLLPSCTKGSMSISFFPAFSRCRRQDLRAGSPFVLHTVKPRGLLGLLREQQREGRCPQQRFWEGASSSPAFSFFLVGAGGGKFLCLRNQGG